MTSSVVPRFAVVVVAAGSGTRLQGGAPKAFVTLGDRTILAVALESVCAAAPAQVVIVVPEGFETDAAGDLRRAAHDPVPPHRIVVGGATRQQSVAAGLAAIDDDIDTVLVHDAARALTPASQFTAVARAVQGRRGVIAALPVVNTLKRVDGERVVEAVDRSVLVAAQTPQGFPRAALVAAYRVAEASGIEYTDDAALFAAAGGEVIQLPGDPSAFKITTRADLERARSLREPRMPRVGVGTDVHAFGGSGSLWLAGLEWPGERALSGHSDGDAVAHAIVDALLSAAGLGDIGQHFGTSSPEFAGAHADAFLARTRELVEAAGYTIGNVSVQVQCNRPRFASRRAEAEQALSDALGGAPVSVSATTTDGLGFTGRGEGVFAAATALVFPRS